MKQTSRFVIALLFGHVTLSDAHKLKSDKKASNSYPNTPKPGFPQGLPWDDDNVLDTLNENIASNQELYNDASVGKTCFGKPCSGSLLQIQEHPDVKPALPGLPWNDNSFYDESHAEVEKHGAAYSDVNNRKECFGKPCKDADGNRQWHPEDLGPNASSLVQTNQPSLAQTNQPKGDFEMERDLRESYPHRYIPDHDNMHAFVKEKIDAKTGGYITEWELGKAAEAEAQKKLEETWKKPYFMVPADMIMDWDGDCYAKHSKTFGKECSQYGNKEANQDFSNARKVAYLQTDAQLNAGNEARHKHRHRLHQRKAAGFPYGAPEKDRDAAAGHPMDAATVAKHAKFVDYMVGANGNYLTPWEVGKRQDAELEKAQQAAANKPSYVVPDSVIDDWTGHKYVDQHYGHPATAANIQVSAEPGTTATAEKAAEVVGWRSGTFPLGDLQSHRYLNFHHFVPDKEPFEKHQDKEHVPNLVGGRFDDAAGRFKSVLEVQNDGELGAAAGDADKARKYAGFDVAKLPTDFIDDWTGQRFVHPNDPDDLKYINLGHQHHHKHHKKHHHKHHQRAPVSLAQPSLAEEKKKWESGSFPLGDLQEHRYNNFHNWVPGKVPAHVHHDKEDVRRVVDRRFDSSEGRFKSELEVLDDAEKAAAAAQEAAANKPAYTPPPWVSEDWTGTKFTEPPYFGHAKPDSLSQVSGAAHSHKKHHKHHGHH